VEGEGEDQEVEPSDSLRSGDAVRKPRTFPIWIQHRRTRQMKHGFVNNNSSYHYKIPHMLHTVPPQLQTKQVLHSRS
jgi:hypothetical protein